MLPKGGTDAMEKSSNRLSCNWYGHLMQLASVSFAFLAFVQSTASTCDNNPSEVNFQSLSLSSAISGNLTEFRFRTFDYITLSGCEKECSLRKQCSAYNYHWVMHLCELFDIEFDEIALQRLVSGEPESVFRIMGALTRQEILTECRATDCPVGTVCSCGQSQPSRCEVAECPKPTVPENVIILGNCYGVGHRLSSICARGYAPAIGVGVSRVCLPTGQWSGKDPVCALACEPPQPPDNGSIFVSARNIFPALAQFNCDEGNILVGSSVLMCMQNGTWNDTAPTCIQDSLLGIDCGDLSPPGNGTVDANGTTVGSTAVYTCLDGFELSGVARISCLQTGYWSDLPPQCVVLIDCGPLDAPTKGFVTSGETTIGSNATFSCEIGFELIGEATVLCLDTGSWSGSPTCEIKDCGPLKPPENGLINTSMGTTFRSVAEYSCEIGFDLDGVARVQCLEDGQWSDPAPFCDIRDCGPLKPPENGSVDMPMGTTFRSIAEYSCETGFDLDGTARVQCLEDGQWSDPAPVCDIKDCGPPTKLEHGLVSVNRTTYGENATYSCDAGYELTRSSQSTCLSNGSWSWLDSSCQKKAMMFQPCTDDLDCWEPNSECRDKTCGCKMGYSYLPGKFRCVDSLAWCLAYGTTFQLFQHDHLLSANHISYYGYTLDQCKYTCIQRENCTSADYVPNTKACHISKESWATNAGLMMEDTDFSVVYLHRDCACSGSKEECSGCGIRPAVRNASLVDMTLPDGAILGTEEGVMLSYLCDFQHHMYGETMIVSVCGEDGEWTNLDAKCEHETQTHYCTEDSECLEPNSECRGFLCTCKIGYSYSKVDFSCVEDCPLLGTTFQHVQEHHFEPDQTILLTIATDIDYDDCKENCLTQIKIKGIECKAADYNENTRECRTYSESARTMPSHLIEEPDSSYAYLHRDCLCPESSASCSGCAERIPVPNARLTQVHLPEGAFWGNEFGVVHVYMCKDGFYNQDNTTIESKCTENDAEWTNNVATCLKESMYLTCAENSDCTEAFSECRVTEDLKPKKCGCLLGFSYFPDQHACIEAECLTYVSTFQVFPSTQLLDGESTVLDSRTLDECEKECISFVSWGRVCASFNYNKATMQCELNQNSILNLPGLTEVTPDVSYYHRDCASADEPIGDY